MLSCYDVGSAHKLQATGCEIQPPFGVTSHYRKPFLMPLSSRSIRISAIIVISRSKMPERILFYDNEQQPVHQPPAGPVRVTDYRVMPWPDGTRVTVGMG